MEGHIKNGVTEFVAHVKYLDFVFAEDKVEVSDLPDEDLRVFRNICRSGAEEADEELRKRGL